MFSSKFMSLPSNFFALSSGALKCWRLTCQSRRRQCAPLCESFVFDEVNFAPDPRYLRIQIGREDAGRVRVVGRRFLVLFFFPRSSCADCADTA